MKKIAGSLSTEIYKPDQRIITKGDSGSTMYIIARGNVKVHDEEYTVAQLHKGESLGIFSLLDDAPRSMSVTAIDETEVLFFGFYFWFIGWDYFYAPCGYLYLGRIAGKF